MDGVGAELLPAGGRVLEHSGCGSGPRSPKVLVSGHDHAQKILLPGSDYDRVLGSLVFRDLRQDEVDLGLGDGVRDRDRGQGCTHEAVLEPWVRKGGQVSMGPGIQDQRKSAVVDEGWHKGAVGGVGQNSAGGVVDVLGPVFRAVGGMETYASFPIGYRKRIIIKKKER